MLTLRNCYAWLDSFINHSLYFVDVRPGWDKLRDFRFKTTEAAHPPKERILKEQGFYTIDGCLSYWANHNQKVLDTVSKDRLLIVKTNGISQRAYDIAAFAGLPKEAVRLEKTFSFKNPKKAGVLCQIDRNYLEEKVKNHCASLMAQYFPEIRSIDDSGI